MIAESDFREKVSQLLSQENFVVPHDLMHRQNLESSTEKKIPTKDVFRQHPLESLFSHRCES